MQQQTDYPSSGRVLLKVDPSQPAEFSLRLRIPRWCQEAKITVNGQPVQKPVRSGTYYAISRKWQAGDRVEMDMPMPLRFVRGRQSQAGRVAVMRGPVVFCLSRERNQDLGTIDPRLITLVPSSLKWSDPGRFGAAGRDGVYVFRRGSRVPGILRPGRSCIDADGVCRSFGRVSPISMFPIPNAREFVDDELVERVP